MAEITSQDLYNQLTPMGQLYYDQQFSKQYQPGQENILLSSQPEFEKMKSVFEAQEQIPDKSFLDSINIFSSASAAEPAKQNINNKYLESLYTPDMQETIFGDRNYFKNQDTSNFPFRSMADLAAENANLNLFPAPLNVDNPTYMAKQNVNFNPDMPLAPLEPLGFDTSFGVANEPDVAEVDSVGNKEDSGIMKLINFLIPGSNLANFLPKEAPEISSMKDFYRRTTGLDNIGRIASGVMKGYNPVYGGLLNMLTGGKFGEPTQFGLATAARDRINKIANRKRAQTAASRQKIKELQEFARADTISRGRQANPGVYAAAEALGLIDQDTGGFKSAGTNENFSNKTGRGRTGY